MSTTAKIIGLYEVVAHVGVYLIEVLVKESVGIFNIGEFTQETPGQRKENWQVAYDEVILDAEGKKIVADGLSARYERAFWVGDVRLAFFFHFLDSSRPLQSPFGDLPLPQQSTKPDRLSIIEYVPPD